MQSVYFHQIVFTISDFLCVLLQETKKLQTYHNWFWLILAVWQITKGLDLGLSPPNHANYFAKILPLTISISWPSFKTKYTIMHDSKGIFRK